MYISSRAIVLKHISGSDIWGWTQYDEESGAAVSHYALTCQTDGVSIVDITDPIHPNVLAYVESNVSPIRHVNWRDMKGLLSIVSVELCIAVSPAVLLYGLTLRNSVSGPCGMFSAHTAYGILHFELCYRCFSSSLPTPPRTLMVCYVFNYVHLHSVTQ